MTSVCAHLVCRRPWCRILRSWGQAPVGLPGNVPPSHLVGVGAAAVCSQSLWGRMGRRALLGGSAFSTCCPPAGVVSLTQARVVWAEGSQPMQRLSRRPVGRPAVQLFLYRLMTDRGGPAHCGTPGPAALGGMRRQGEQASSQFPSASCASVSASTSPSV